MQSRMISVALASLLALCFLASPALAQRGGWGGGGRGWGYGGYGYRGYGYGYGRFGYGYGGYGWGGVGIGIGFGWPYYGGYPYGPYYYDGIAYPYASMPLMYSNPAAPYPATPPALIGAQQPAPPAGPAMQTTQGPSMANNGSAPANTQTFYAGPPATPGRAELIVKVPSSNAQVGIGALQSEQSGLERHFYFPSLAGDKTFTIRGQWTENGQLVTREKQINMRAGQTITLDLSDTAEAKAASPQSTPPPVKPLPRPVPKGG